MHEIKFVLPIVLLSLFIYDWLLMKMPDKRPEPQALKNGTKPIACFPNSIFRISEKEQSNLEPDNSAALVGGCQLVREPTHAPGQGKPGLCPHEIQEFAEAWKSQSNFNILVIQKLSLIVSRYFKLLAQADQRNHEIEVLIVYNKSLIQILNKFEDQERKLIQKLRTMEDFNSKIMKELCSLKNRHFSSPQIKTEESIFSKFSLKNLKYEPPPAQPQQSHDKYEQKIEDLFRQHLLQRADHYMPAVEQKIEQLSLQLGQRQRVAGPGSHQLKLSSTLEQLVELRQDIQTYHQKLGSVNCDNMFDLYQLKCAIKSEARRLQMGNLEGQTDPKQMMFVSDVKKIYAGLAAMNEDELQGYLKREKEIRRRMKKQRVKEQAIFLQACQQAQSQNMELKADVRKLKQKIVSLEDEVSHAKAEIQFKTMKQKRASKSSMLLDESSLVETDPKLPGKKHKMQQEHRKQKEQVDRLSRAIEQSKTQAERQRMAVFIKLRENKIEVEQSMSCMEMIELLLIQYQRRKHAAFENSRRPQLIVSSDKEEDLVSPRLDDKGIVYGFNQLSTLNFLEANSYVQGRNINLQRTQRLNTLQKKRLQQLESGCQKLEKTNKELLQKLLLIQKEKEQKCEQLISKLTQKQKQLLEYKSKYENVASKEVKYQQQIHAKTQQNTRNARQAEVWRQQQARMRHQIEQLIYENQCAEKLANRIMKTVQVLSAEDISSDKFLVFLDQMIANLHQHLDQYRLEIKAERHIERVTSFGHFHHDRGPHKAAEMQSPPKLKQSSKHNKQSQDHFGSSSQQRKVITSVRVNGEVEAHGRKLEEYDNKESIIFRSSNLLLHKANHEEGSVSSGGKVQTENSEAKFKAKTGKLIQKQGKLESTQSQQAQSKRQNIGASVKHATSNNQFKISPIFTIKASRLTEKVDEKQEQIIIQVSKPGFGPCQLEKAETGKTKMLPEKCKQDPKQASKAKQMAGSQDQVWPKLGGKQAEQNKLYPLSFSSTSSKRRGGAGNMEKSQKPSQGSVAQVRLPGMNEINLSLSEDELELEEELGIHPNSSLYPNNRRNLHLSRLDKSAVNAGIELMLVEKMFQKFQRLSNDDDVLDFYQLFQRYKEALKCLEKSEQLNKLHEIRYQKFIESVKGKQKADGELSLEHRLHYLERQVLEQEEQLTHQKDEFETSVIEHIKVSEYNINQYLKLMRREQQAKKKQGLLS